MRAITKSVEIWRNRITEIAVMPERFKGTFVEKWALYWRGLLNDYSEVATGIIKESYTKPKKAIAYASGGYVLYQLALRNPDEATFTRVLRNYSNRLIQVAPQMQNPIAVEYLCSLERAVNRNQIRLLSLGFCTLLWIDVFDKDDCTYPATCEYTKVSVWDFHRHVVDIGFWNQFWLLKWKMRNYDINYL